MARAGIRRDPARHECTRGTQAVPTSKRLPRRSVPSRNHDPLDLAEGHLQEAGADFAEGGRLTRAEEAVVAFVAALLGEPGGLEGALHGGGDGVTAADQADV